MDSHPQRSPAFSVILVHFLGHLLSMFTIPSRPDVCASLTGILSTTKSILIAIIMSAPEFLADFTEDTQDPRACDRCTAILQPGDGHLIRSFKPGQVDKLVCTKCCEYYQTKPTTIRAPAKADIRKTVLPDPKAIRASVSAAQARSTVNPPPVVAMSKPARVSSTNMPPPRAKLPKHGPEVHVPSTWAPSVGQPPAGSLPSGSTGYSDQHLQYAAQRARWANVARRVPSAETISLEISAVYEGGGKRRHPRTNIIGSICEGLKDIDAHSTAQELASIALKTAVPRITTYDTKFPWRPDEFIVRDKTWVNLSANLDVTPYFYNECLHASKAKNSKAMVFKAAQFNLYVVVPDKQWTEYERFQEKSNMDSLAVAPPRARRGCRSVTLSRNTSASSSINPTHPAAPVAPTSPIPVGSVSSSKRHHHHSSSVGSVSSRSPPPKRPIIFTSPDCNELREALRMGGSSDFDILHARKQSVVLIDFHPIPTVDIDHLVHDKLARAFNEKTAELFPGRLRLNCALDALLGVGAFKTAQAATLTLWPLRSSGIGSQQNHPIVIKRCYMHVTPDEKDTSTTLAPFQRLSLGEEANRLHREANILYWAKALLKMTYDFIDRSIDDAGESPPFEIPRLHFVDAGILVGFSEGIPPSNTEEPPLTGKAKAAGSSSVYLAEEVIASGDDDSKFVKFIHNGDASPRKFSVAALNEVANFLSFTQHLQYVKTGGLAFLSDYQGCPPVLTDPQILTHPDVSDDKELFGDGNFETGVELFETQHECNKFCLWSGFGLHVFGDATSSVESGEEA